ncbi:MAG: glycosyltransferase [Cyclonatronaceae bacterium]
MTNVLLPPREDVVYIVSQQYRDADKKRVPADLLRDDVIVSHIPGSGVTRSRNNALDLASGDIGIFSDDDVTYLPEDFDTIRKTMNQYPDVDVAKFKIRTPDGQPEYKEFPEEEYDLLRSESTGTVQLVVRLKRVKECGIRFDTRFGAGNPRLIGADEQIFIHDCIKAGLKVRFFPIYIVEHPYVSTAKRIPPYDARKNRVTGGLDARINGWIAVPKAFAGTIRYLPAMLRHRCNPLMYLWHRLTAALYVLTTRPEG